MSPVLPRQEMPFMSVGDMLHDECGSIKLLLCRRVLFPPPHGARRLAGTVPATKANIRIRGYKYLFFKLNFFNLTSFSGHL
jgi:hypothetical protein